MQLNLIQSYIHWQWMKGLDEVTKLTKRLREGDFVYCSYDDSYKA